MPEGEDYRFYWLDPDVNKKVFNNGVEIFEDSEGYYTVYNVSEDINITYEIID